MDNKALNTESVLSVQQNIGKINIICDDDLDKKFDNKIWKNDFCNDIAHNKT